MNIQDALCKEFCSAITVRKVPAGYAVGTGYDNYRGDPLGFFVIGPNSSGKFRVEDDGLSIALLEAHGVDFGSKTRRQVFSGLLKEYGIERDEDGGELATDLVTEREIPNAAMRFIAFMLRVQDMLLLTQSRVESTFREDATLKIREALAGSQVEIEESVAVHKSLEEIPPDLILRAPNREPVALFFGISDIRILEALLLQSYAQNKNILCSVVALIESENTLAKKTFVRANNHLDAVPIYRGAEEDAINRVRREVLGQRVVH